MYTVGALIYYKNLWASIVLQLLLLDKINIWFTFWVMTKSEAVNKIKNFDLQKQSGQVWLRIKISIIVMLNNTPEPMIYKHSYHQINRQKQLEKGGQYYEEN